MNTVLLIVNLVVISILIWGVNTKLNDLKKQVENNHDLLEGLKCYELRLIKEKLDIPINNWEKRENEYFEEKTLERFSEHNQFDDFIDFYKTVGGKEPYNYGHLYKMYAIEEYIKFKNYGILPRSFNEFLIDYKKRDIN